MHTTVVGFSKSKFVSAHHAPAGPEATNSTWYGHALWWMCDECVHKHTQARGACSPPGKN